MGAVSLPTSGSVYIDANTFIYSVEEIAPYWRLLEPLWVAAKKNALRLLSSELLVLEALTGPKKKNRPDLFERYERVLGSGDVRLVPVSIQVLRKSVDVRAMGLKTPDAIHAATALLNGCTTFLTNDIGFRRVPELNTVILSELSVT